MIFKTFFKQIRISHWIKNLLVFAPLFFGGHVLRVDELGSTAMLFAAFCMLASSIYIFNDILDRESDALHPKKKHRPIASGAMSIKTGIFIMIIFLVIAMLLASQFNFKANLLLSLYFILNLGYSMVLKHIPIVDIFLIAAMYLLRIKAGGELIDVYVSEWLILVTLFLALFLVIGKRRAEITSKTAEKTREVLKGYTKEFLDYLLLVVVSGVMLTYSLYAVSTEIPYLMYSTFIVFFGMFRYMYVVYILGGGEAPEKVLYQDIWILLTVIAWALYMFFVFYNALF
ncbi:MAG: decaprenyl-phosphate phosphoribosyltransferase [Candidatus Peregrinibacteria bacterium]|nr:decaprenyl-phosphate phosphoribosyltransferase [Candidatus Peregrinibacteria bacterium]MDZ4245462.1 decaprenyl-phosphate phosphoribosyltransferase [Candidatus Gracilibacteria bacterium]